MQKKKKKSGKGCIDLTNFNVLSRYETPAPDTSAAVCLGNNTATLQPPLTPIHHPHIHTQACTNHTDTHMLPAGRFFRRPLVMWQMMWAPVPRGPAVHLHDFNSGNIQTYKNSHTQNTCIHKLILCVVKHKEYTCMGEKTQLRIINSEARTSERKLIHLWSCYSDNMSNDLLSPLLWMMMKGCFCHGRWREQRPQCR